MTFVPGWHVIYTKPKHERKVAFQLEKREINLFLPATKVWRNWHDRRKLIEVPLFPSYIFIYLRDKKDYYEGMEVQGAMYYVKSGKETARVDQSVIDNIKLVTSEAKDIQISDCRFQSGQKLIIRKGALAGLSCEVVDFKGKQMMLVRIDLLQRNILLTLSADDLMTIPRQSNRSLEMPL